MADVRGIANTVKLINSLWPDFTINVQLMKQPTCEFIVDFFTRFVREIQEKLSIFTCEEVNLVYETRDFDYTVYLCAAVSKIIKNLKCGTDVTLIDLCNPTPKKTSVLLRVAIHFLIFSNNNMEDLLAVHTQGSQQYRDQILLEAKVKDLTEEVNNNAYKLGHVSEQRDKLREKFGKIKDNYSTMLEEKEIRENKYSSKYKEITRLTDVTQNLELKIQQSRKEEAKLSEQVISDEDFKNLKETYQVKINEMEELSLVDASLENTLGEQTRLLTHLEEVVTGLDLSVDSLLVKEWQEGEALFVKKETEIEKLRAASASLLADRINKEKEVNIFKETLVKVRDQLTETKITSLQKLEMLKKTQKLKSEDHANKIALWKNLKNDVLQIQKRIADVDNQLEKLKIVSACEFKKMIDAENSSVDNFVKILQDQLQKYSMMMEE